MNYHILIGRLQAARSFQIEWKLIRQIEQLEGRVPTNEEVTKYGEHVIHEDRSESFSWKGQLLFTLPPIEIAE